MTWRARKSTALFALFLLLAGIAFTALTYRTAHAKSEAEKNDAMEKVIVYLKNENVHMKEGKLKKVVHSVYKESRQYDLDYRLALAVIKAESNFQQHAVSNKGARGLMQIKPSLAKYIAKDAGVKYKGDGYLDQPEKNIKLGVYHLARLVEDFKNLPTALHAYNAGETRVRARTSKKEPKTAYTKQVMEEYEKNLSVLPDANELGVKVAPFPNTSRESAWQSVSSSGKISLLQLAERLRNVSEPCRRQGASRSQLYEYKQAFQEGGSQGLDRPPIKSFPDEMPSKVKEKVITLSVAHPSWGQMRVSDQLRLEGISVSPSTVRNIWLEEGLEGRYKRILRL